MIYNMPVKIYEDKNVIEKNKALFSSFGENCLIVTGRSSAKKCGAYDEVVEALTSRNINFYLFDQIEENPSADTIINAVNLMKNNKIDFVIGIGGGSALDAAKAIALLIFQFKGADTKGAELLEYLYDATKSAESLPVIAIPTTCGTGSEATGVSVLTRHDKKSKGSIPHKIFPSIAFVDYRYILSLPKHIVNSSAVDALCHAVEAIINVKANDYSNMFAAEALRVLGSTFPKLASGEPLGILAPQLIHASTLAGMAISHVGTSLPHALSYRLTYNDGIPHGIACAYFLSDFINNAPEKYKEQVVVPLEIGANELYELINKLCSFDSINKETVSCSIEEIRNNPAKLATAPFKFYY